uniref:Uncharacterized protein n=1 Tax=Mycena chlorophos TaxID=658473 RepID=A0ABQ0LPJ1_MYCCL|nr:predicted protein [Mycena chlorophos]
MSLPRQSEPFDENVEQHLLLLVPWEVREGGTRLQDAIRLVWMKGILLGEQIGREAAQAAGSTGDATVAQTAALEAERFDVGCGLAVKELVPPARATCTSRSVQTNAPSPSSRSRTAATRAPAPADTTQRPILRCSYINNPGPLPPRDLSALRSSSQDPFSGLHRRRRRVNRARTRPAVLPDTRIPAQPARHPKVSAAAHEHEHQASVYIEPSTLLFRTLHPRLPLLPPCGPCRSWTGTRIVSASLPTALAPSSPLAADRPVPVQYGRPRTRGDGASQLGEDIATLPVDQLFALGQAPPPKAVKDLKAIEPADMGSLVFVGQNAMRKKTLDILQRVGPALGQRECTDYRKATSDNIEAAKTMVQTWGLEMQTEKMQTETPAKDIMGALFQIVLKMEEEEGKALDETWWWKVLEPARRHAASHSDHLLLKQSDGEERADVANQALSTLRAMDARTKKTPKVAPLQNRIQNQRNTT